MAFNGESSSNPKFAYPKDRDSIRFLDAQRALDISLKGDKPNSYARRGYKIQRGYMRNLPPATLNEVPISKCYFQFNPQEIKQNVQMREDIYNPILLTAEQLSQPIGGNVSFQFDLFFDRSHELAANPGNPLSPGINESFPSNSPTFEDKDQNTVTKGPELIGVYADLRILYNIIGQGLSDDTIALQLDMLRSTYNAKVARESAYSEATADSATTTTTTTPTPVVEEVGDPFSNDFTDLASVTKLLGDNKGNSAFLLPNPVRIVFSPLLMVDGFVTSTSVDFLKFNNDMIPMQCRVALGVNALYIGFAKQRTFLTTTIETGRNALIEENRADTAAIAPIEKIITTPTPARPFRMGFGVIPVGSTTGPTSWGEALNNGNIEYNDIYWYLIPNNQAGQYIDKRIGYVGFPGIKLGATSENDGDPILKLFEDPNVQFTIGYDWGFTIYGKANQNDYNGVGWTQGEVTDVIKKNSYANTGTGVKVGVYSGSERAQDKEQWGYGSSGPGAKRSCIRRRTYIGNDELPNMGEYELLFSTNERKVNIASSFYIVKYSFKLTITAGSITKEFSFDDPKNYVAVAAGGSPTGIGIRPPGGLVSAPGKVTNILYYV